MKKIEYLMMKRKFYGILSSMTGKMIELEA